MKLYLVQHGRAQSKDIDPQRSLTDEGKEETKRIAGFIKKRALSVDCLWHSGKKRAAQTAEILSGVFNVNNPVETRDGLAPKDDVDKVVSEINAAEGDIMIVGHLPFLSKLASRLLSGREKAEVVKFTYAGIVCLERDEENNWHLEWAVIPGLV